VDAVDDGTTGLLHEPGNVEALATELTRIVRDANLRRALGEAARNRATRDFCQNRVTDAVLGFYARLLDESRTITRRSWYRRGGKRAFDVVAATFAGLLLLPLASALAVVIRMRLGSPVLFRQQRPGRGGRPFVLLKFRTMTDRRGDDGGLLSDAQRLTPLGRFLRAFSLDEIPQLWNVLSGEMSFVGPRPLLMHYLERYTPHQARRHEVRPGITGLAQVGGRNALGWEQKFDLDVTYVERCSLPLDMKILVLTCWQVLTCHGISQPGRATADEFMGTLRT
jgi:lipopolysaccharide/colanic/teichoic acid biosynthesis glycosyltransferase